MTETDIIKRRRLYQEVEARLANDIRDGRLRPGDPLPSERSLMERFGVGRPAIREALFSLSRKGLVSLGSGRRARVATLDVDALSEKISELLAAFASRPGGIGQLHQARVVLEATLAREAAARHDQRDIARIRDALGSNYRAVDDRDAFEATDGAFHKAVGAASGNSLLAAVHAAFVDCLNDQRHAVMDYPDVEMASLALHEDVCRSIEQGSVDGAEHAVRASLDRVDHMFRALSTSPGTGARPVRSDR